MPLSSFLYEFPLALRSPAGQGADCRGSEGDGPPPLLSGESCVCAQVGVCVYVRVCLRVEGMEHTESQALRERGWSLGLRKPGVRVVEGRRVVGGAGLFLLSVSRM